MRMSTSLDINMSATLMVMQHGVNAPSECASTADQFLKAGNQKGSAVWRLIMKEAEDLLSARAKDDVLD